MALSEQYDGITASMLSDISKCTNFRLDTGEYSILDIKPTNTIIIGDPDNNIELYFPPIITRISDYVFIRLLFEYINYPHNDFAISLYIIHNTNNISLKLHYPTSIQKIIICNNVRLCFINIFREIILGKQVCYKINNIIDYLFLSLPRHSILHCDYNSVFRVTIPDMPSDYFIITIMEEDNVFQYVTHHNYTNHVLSFYINEEEQNDHSKRNIIYEIILIENIKHSRGKSARKC